MAKVFRFDPGRVPSGNARRCPHEFCLPIWEDSLDFEWNGGLIAFNGETDSQQGRILARLCFEINRQIPKGRNVIPLVKAYRLIFVTEERHVEVVMPHIFSNLDDIDAQE